MRDNWQQSSVESTHEESQKEAKPLHKHQAVFAQYDLDLSIEKNMQHIKLIQELQNQSNGVLVVHLQGSNVGINRQVEN